MRLLLAITFVVVASTNADKVEKYFEGIKEINNECLDFSKCDKDLIIKFFNGHNVDDPKLRKYIFCSSQKSGYTNEIGERQPEVIKKKLSKLFKDEETIFKIMKKCEQKKDTPEECVFFAVKCFQKAISKKIVNKQQEKVIEYTTDCQLKHGADITEMSSLFGGKLSSDTKLKKFSFCMMKKFHMMDKKGEMNLNIIRATMALKISDEEKIQKIIDKCDVKYDSNEETAYRHIVCRAKEQTP